MAKISTMRLRPSGGDLLLFRCSQRRLNTPYIVDLYTLVKMQQIVQDDVFRISGSFSQVRMHHPYATNAPTRLICVFPSASILVRVYPRTNTDA